MAYEVDLELQNYINILWRRKLPIFLTLLTTMVVVVIGTIRVSPVYQASATLRIAVSGGSTNFSDYQYADRLMNTYISIATSKPVLEELREQLHLTTPPNISVEIIPNTELITITVAYHNPGMAATIANSLADILVAQKLPPLGSGKFSSQELLRSQTAQAKSDFDQAQQAYNTLQAQTLLDTQQLDAAKQLVEIKQNDYVRLNTQYEQVTLEADSQAQNAPLAQKEILAKQKEILAQQLNQAERDVTQAQEAYNTQLIHSLPNSQRLDEAKQLLSLKRDIYETLNTQYIQMNLQGEIRANMVSIVEAAVIPQSSSRPNAHLNYALGLAIGLLGGIGLAFLFENLDTTLYAIEDIEAATKLPALARIPKANSKERGAFQGNFSPFAEAFRILATNLQLTVHQQSKKVLLLVSAAPNQGKSMITFYLACALAELGKRVVAVDCDTRMPKLHGLFYLSNQVGLKDVLEQRVSLEEALQKSAFECVQVLTSGSQLAHPSQMLNSVQMVKLLRSLSQQFDFILLDSPAMLSVADVAALAPNAGGLLLVVRRGYAEREGVQAAGNFLAGQDGKFVGLIVNQVENADHYYYDKDRKRLESLLALVKRISRKRLRTS